MRRWIWALLALAGPAQAQGFYEGRAIVTGMDQRSRPDGLRAGLAQVLARVAGDPALLDDPRVAALDPGPTLVGFAYLDRMSDLPRQDEQGSRDRPYDLVAQFDPAAIAAALRGLGRTVWPEAARPVLTVAVSVTPRVGDAFTLAPDTDVDERHRAALLVAGARFGMALRIDAAPALDARALRGALAWEDGGWRASWSILASGRTQEWTIAGVGFDAAYRNGVGGAARALSAEWAK